MEREKQQVNANRIEAELLRWKEKEDRFRQLFSFDMSTNKAFLKEKLRDYERIIHRYKNTQNPTERFTLQMLRQERKHIEKQLYPNLLVRMVRRFVINPVRRYFIQREISIHKKANQKDVFRQMRDIGMDSHFSKATRMMKQENKDFSLPITHYVEDSQRMENQLLFNQAEDGSHKLTAHRVSLINENNAAENRSHTFDLQDGERFQAREAFNLLNGRAVCKSGNWMCLDLNDRDAAGNYRMKTFPSSHGYDIEKSLQTAGVKEIKDPAKKEGLITALGRGEKVSVTIGRKSFLIEANPQHKSINIYNKDNLKVSSAVAQGKQNVVDIKQGQNLSGPARRNGMKMN